MIKYSAKSGGSVCTRVYFPTIVSRLTNVHLINWTLTLERSLLWPEQILFFDTTTIVVCCAFHDKIMLPLVRRSPMLILATTSKMISRCSVVAGAGWFWQLFGIAVSYYGLNAIFVTSAWWNVVWFSGDICTWKGLSSSCLWQSVIL